MLNEELIYMLGFDNYILFKVLFENFNNEKVVFKMNDIEKRFDIKRVKQEKALRFLEKHRIIERLSSSKNNGRTYNLNYKAFNCLNNVSKKINQNSKFLIKNYVKDDFNIQKIMDVVK